MTAVKTRYGHLSAEELRALLERRDAERKFGLIWERRATEHERALNDDFVALDLLPELSVGDGPWRNLVIEGDNFDALRFLNLTHRGQIKCIYIDPPYNTGNQDFVYNDHYLDKEDSFRHSTWLEFMFRRLSLARDLLREDGVIFVSIDDNEVAPLTMLLDQLFPGGKVGTFVWRRRSGKSDVPDTFVSVDHEYVLCYRHPSFSFKGTGKALSDYKEHDPGNPDPWKRGDLSKPHNYRARPNGFYPVHDPERDIWYPPNPKRVWAFASRHNVKGGQKLRRETMEELIETGRVVFPKKDQVVTYEALEDLKAAIREGTAPRYLQLGLFDTPEEEEAYLSFYVGKRVGYGTPGYKRFRSEVKTASKPVSTWIAGIKEALDDDALTVMRTGLNADGTALLGQIFQNSKVDFNFPKPLTLLKALIAQATGPDDIVLDFFAGSGTTGHAVLALNAEEELADRRFILVSSTEATQKAPDKNICRDVTRERLRRVSLGYTYRALKNNVEVEGLGGDFAYLRTRRIPVSQVIHEVSHPQVWWALQLMHGQNLDHFRETHAIQQARQDSLLLYLTEVDRRVLEEVAALALGAEQPVVVYSWQPALVEQHLMLDSVSVLKIPDILFERFTGAL